MPSSEDPQDLLAEYALGILDADQAREVATAVARDRKLAQELDSLERAGADLALVAPQPPNLDTTRLLADAASAARFSPFVDEMVRLTEMSEAHARAMLQLIDTGGHWDPPTVAGADIMHIDGDNPRTDGAEIGFVRLDPGATFPQHSHDGDEEYLVLQGACRDTSSSRIIGAGDRVLNVGGSAHNFSTVGKRPFIFVVVSHGITF